MSEVSCKRCGGFEYVKNGLVGGRQRSRALPPSPLHSVPGTCCAGRRGLVGCGFEEIAYA